MHVVSVFFLVHADTISIFTLLIIVLVFIPLSVSPLFQDHEHAHRNANYSLGSLHLTLPK
jgi:hypothetical protein